MQMRKDGMDLPENHLWGFGQKMPLFLILAILLPIFASANPYFEAACLNIRASATNTVLYLELQPKLLHIDEATGDLTTDVKLEISFRNPQNGRIVHRREVREATGHDFMTSDNSFFHAYRFDLLPGRYQVIIEVLDAFDGRIHLEEFPYDCRDLRSDVALSDIIMVQEFGGVLAPQPLLGDNIRAVPERLRFSTDIYANAQETYTARAVLYRRQNDQRRQGDDGERMQVRRYAAVNQLNEIIAATPGTNLYSDQLKLDELPHGEYLLEIFLYRGEQLIAEVSRKFIIDWKYLRDIFGDLDAAISKMKYAASPDRLAQLKEIEDPDEKMKAFLDFWRHRSDPAHANDLEALERYFDRVYFAEEHFQEDQAGWETDRGRIYALYGAPDRQSSFQNANVFYEVWTYRKWGLRFLFRADDAGRMKLRLPGSG